MIEWVVLKTYYKVVEGVKLISITLAFR